MGVITYTAASLTLKSTWTRANNQKPATIAEGTRRFTVTRIPPNATVRSAVLTFDLDGAAYGLNSNYRLCTAYGVNVSNNGSAQKQSVRINITANRTIDVVFRYQAFEYSGEVGKSYYRTVTFGTTRNPLTLTIEFDEGDDPGYIDNEVMEPARGVYLYGPNETDFEKNGIKLQPISCTVSEEAGGEYELEMEHPFDPEGRWQSILEDCIIDAPVPPHKIPEITMPVGKVYRVKSTVTKTPLYSKLPVYSASKSDGKQAPARWSAKTAYVIGDTVWEYYNSPLYGNTATIFRSGGDNFGADQSPTTGGTWAVLGPVTPTTDTPGTGTGQYKPGVIIKNLVANEMVTYIATYNWKYVRVRDSLGRIGYAIKADLNETSTAPQPYTIPGRRIYRQYFRVYSVSCDEVGHTLSVSARHISYDLDGNATFDCSMTEAEPATAIALLQGSMMLLDLLQYKPHYTDEAEDAESRKRLIACPMTSPTITADWSFRNPVQAILDPEEGLAGQLQARVERDNGDIFLLPQSPVREGPRLAYGVNLTGVSWTRSSEEIITRIIPRADDGKSGKLYLDELYIDSPHINDYPFPRIEVLDSEYAIGQKIEHADGSTETLSKTAVIERMRQEAENRYYVDGADKATVTLDVEFILLGDTEEYRQYRNLQRVCLYDRIRIDTGHTTATAQVIGYEWDCLAGRYSAVSIGKVYSQARRQIPGYRMATGAVTYNKLSPGLIKWIKGAT